MDILALAELIAGLLAPAGIGALITTLYNRKKHRRELKTLNDNAEDEMRERLRKEAGDLRDTVLTLEQALFDIERLHAEQVRREMELEDKYSLALNKITELEKDVGSNINRNQGKKR